MPKSLNIFAKDYIAPTIEPGEQNKKKHRGRILLDDEDFEQEEVLNFDKKPSPSAYFYKSLQLNDS